jgi:phenylalanyl-tRNA synthetase beta chain
VAPSPAWLQERLSAIGLRPINNVVDITNFICHGLGQPMHAYDWNEIKGGQLIVDTLAAGTTFKTLDGIERKLTGEELMICDASGAIGMAGVMGGEDSGIKDSTTRVFLEVAHFKPERIRKASQIHGLKTDASFRFERGTDIQAKLFALEYAAQLIQELAGGNPTPVSLVEIPVSVNRVQQYIGIALAAERIKEILTLLDFTIKADQGDEFIAVSPAYRVDVTREADIIEEILRIHGLDNIPLSDHLSANFIS